MKACTKCNIEKPLSDYHRYKLGRDGRKSQCKTCTSAHMAEYYARPDVRAQRAEYKAEYYADRKTSTPQLYWETGYTERSKGYGFTPIVESFTRDELIERYGDECWHCKGEWSEIDHHPLPVAHGGPHTLENTKPSCTPCNRPGRSVTRLNITEQENK